MATSGERRGRKWTVAPHWRALGAALALFVAAASVGNETAFNALFRLDARVIDFWQRLAGPDEPGGEVIVVGVDSAAIREKGRWPWGRADLAELVEIIAAAGPRSLTVDILLTEPGPYSEVNLMRAFRTKGPEAIGLLPVSPDARLAAAIASAPTTLAVAGGAARVIDDLPGLTECADPAFLKAEPRAFHVECLLFPLPLFEAAAAGLATAFAEQDLDGVVRRARAFVGQPYAGTNGERIETFLPALPLGAVTSCAAVDPTCLRYDTAMDFLSAGGERRLALTRADGSGPPPAPLTPSLALWLDFGALEGLGPEGTGPARMVSAAALFQHDEAEAARLAGRHVILGLTRLGSIDQYTTPLANESGAPGVLIQALAADNLLTGRVLEEPEWARTAAIIYAGFAAFLALIRFGGVSVTALVGFGILSVLAPFAASWLAFTFAGLVLFTATPALAALLAGAPVIYGRVAALRRDLTDARETQAREDERMDAAREIQLGSLPFGADFSALGFETEAICRPAQEVGGDFFELFQLTDGRLFAAVGDVSGKGLEASLVTALSKSIAGAVTDRVAGPLGDAMREVSREFIRQAPTAWRRDKGGFVTLVFARINPQTGEAEFAAAGCEPPTVFSADGARREVVLPSVAPLGWLENAAFETCAMTLSPGDTILMFTDGVGEAETPAGELFGQMKAEETARRAAGSARAMVAALDSAVTAHQAGRAPTDDTTILAATWRGAIPAAEV
ncbi:MAG: SpoIIE family protein phosphatase [Paracoccaceae bacterium]